jgi:hypothetical protein
MSKNILSVSYDSALLATREMLLEQKGYEVTSAKMAASICSYSATQYLTKTNCI